MGRVLVFGTFDGLHPGHIVLLKRAASFGPVTISLTSDALCRLYKGVSPDHPYALRAERLRKLRYVRHIRSSDSIPNSYEILEVVKPTHIVLGHDQLGLASTIKQRLEGRPVSIIINPPYRRHLYASSLMHRYFRIS